MSDENKEIVDNGGGGGGGMVDKAKNVVNTVQNWVMENRVASILIAVVFVLILIWVFYYRETDNFTNGKMQGLSGTEVDPEVRKLVEKINKGLDDYRKAGGV
ncbi:MAG: hypothetical protein CMK92_04885 [Pseudomonas sp.]|nr:hypothetical protein [Pseudomonas sp.]